MAKIDERMRTLLKSIFQNWPNPLEKKTSAKITKEQGKILNFLGEGDPTHFTILASTDKLTVGISKLIPGARYFASVHKESDEFYYILSGTLTVLINDVDSYDVHEGEGFLIAAGDRHEVFNFNDSMCVVFFCIAPEL
jgi:mannose-6-phosphate isomerase-like protein (cupin superfamily)